MKSYKVVGERQLQLVEATTPLSDTRIKVKVNRIGLSRSDVASYLAGEQIVIGRQCVGMVSEIGANASVFSRGDRVVLEPYTICSACENCRSELEACCENIRVAGSTIDGFGSDFVNVEKICAHQLPDSVKDSDAVFVEHIAIAISAINRLQIQKGEHMVIVGGGLIGLIMAQLAIYYQVVPILIDSQRQSLELATKLGIYYTINCVDSDPYKKIVALTGGRRAENVVYVTDTALPFGTTTDYVMCGGKMAVIGLTHSSSSSLGSIDEIIKRQVTLLGISNGYGYFPAAINMLANKSVVVSPLITKEIDFAELPQYIEEMVEHPYEYSKLIVKN